MNKISQKMKTIATKLSANGFKDRAEQFMILADNIEEEFKMQKMSSVRELPPITSPEPVHIDQDALKQVLKGRLTPYLKYKE